MYTPASIRFNHQRVLQHQSRKNWETADMMQRFQYGSPSQYMSSPSWLSLRSSPRPQMLIMPIRTSSSATTNRGGALPSGFRSLGTRLRSTSHASATVSSPFTLTSIHSFSKRCSIYFTAEQKSLCFSTDLVAKVRCDLLCHEHLQTRSVSPS